MEQDHPTGKKVSFFNKILEWSTWWHVDPKQLEVQVENYKVLSVIQSYRGLAALLVLAGGIFEILRGALVAIIFIPIAYLIYRGNKAALVVTMLLFTLNIVIGFLILDSSVNGMMMVIIIWLLVMKYLYGAYRVERIRSKK